MDEITLSLNETSIKKLRKSAKADAIADYGEDDTDYLVFNKLRWDADIVEFKDGTLSMYGSMLKGKTDVGYLSVEIPIDIDIASEIIIYFLKKVNRLKTVLESLK